MTALNLVYVLAFIDFIGVNASRVVLQLFALDLHASPTEVGLLIALYYVCPLLLSWPAGRIVDRYGPRTPLLLGALGSAVGMLFPCVSATLTAVFIAAATSGIATTFYSVALQNMVGVMSKPEHRARNYSNYAMAISTAAAAGPLLAGFSFDGRSEEHTSELQSH